MNRLQHGKQKLLLLFAATVVIALWCACQIPCPLRALTGIPCPSCGMTHAFLALLRGDISAAFAAHAFWPGVPLLLLLLLFDGRPFRQRCLNSALWIVLGVGYLTAYVVRLLSLLP